MGKDVKIIGLSIKQGFGALKAVDLDFDEHNRLTLVKGEVGAGKTTFKRAAELVTKGSSTLEDKNLYGNVDIETQLLDGDRKVFVGCKSDDDGKLVYTLYEYDDNGKKVQNPVIDGVKATPAAYLKELQTKLTWRLEELTSENPITQRNLLLELYAFELEAKGVVFNKKSPNYVGGIIDEIEKAKDKRNYLDAKRKEVGGIADDLRKKGIDVNETRIRYDVQKLRDEISQCNAEIVLKRTNIKQTRETELTALKSKGIEIASKLKDLNNLIVNENAKALADYNQSITERKDVTQRYNQAKDYIFGLLNESDYNDVKMLLNEKMNATYQEIEEPIYKKVLEFNDKGSIISDPQQWWKENRDIFELLRDYRLTLKDWQELNARPLKEVDTFDLEQRGEALNKKLEIWQEENSITDAVDAYQQWKEQNKIVSELNKTYFLKLTEIETGVKGLKITPEYKTLEDGSREAVGNDIFLMYDGSYDPKYFANPKGELRKLSSYSDTQKPMICLLIQNYLLRKKSKTMPYLWIDQVPLDNKTIELLKKMSEELNLWLFVNWTGDFDREGLQAGEILIENGEIFFNE